MRRSLEFLLSSGLMLSLLVGSVQGFGSISWWGSKQQPASLILSSFVSRRQQQHLERTTTRRTTSRQPHLSMVIDRLSDDCIDAIKHCHDIGNDVGLSQVGKELLFVGVVRHPERARATLEKYDIQSAEVERASLETIKSIPGIPLSIGGNPTREALPFSPDAKLILNKACSIADSMESPVTRSEHVILALMGYNNGRKIETSPLIDVLANMRGLSSSGGQRNFRVFDFCEDLVNALPLTAYKDAAEPVRIGGTASGNTNTLSEVGIDMTELALRGEYDPVYGRTRELTSALRTLGRRRKNNPCLIGDPGVGKTAVAEALAQVLAKPLGEMEAAKGIKLPELKNPFAKKEKVPPPPGLDEELPSVSTILGYELPKCPKSLEGYRLINVDLASLVAGTSNRGDFEKKVKDLIEQASREDVILFVDELHNLIGTGGGGDGAMNAANLLKPALARGELRVLGATTTPEYRRYIEKDGALERRFQPLEVKEPTVEETIEILAAVFCNYETYHGVQYTSKALTAAAKLSARYITDRFLPDKAIDLLDEAGSMVKMNGDNDDGEILYVTEDDIVQVVSELSGIPLGKLDTGEKSRLRILEQSLQARIKGQDTAVKAVAKSIRRARSGMRNANRPVASFMFCGPTGVGKTELCKTLASTYFGRESDMIRLDMSEYMDRFSTSRLIGAPPGYVGYDEGGQLTNAVRRRPHSLILLDEIEKAHEDVLNLLLQVLEDGVLTDGKGNTVNFKNSIIVMTSNIGGKDIIDAVKQERGEGDDSSSSSSAALNAGVVQAALEDAMRPELLNRIDEIVVFEPLGYDTLKEIANNLVTLAIDRARDDVEIGLQVSDNLVEVITREAMASASIYGARPIRRAVQRYVEDPVAEALVALDDFIQPGDDIRLTLVDPNNRLNEKRIVEITNLSANRSGTKKLQVDVNDDTSLDVQQSSPDEQAAFGDLPPMSGNDDDDEGGEPPKREPDAFQ